MPEASQNPLSGRRPMGDAAPSTEVLKSSSVRSPKGLEPSVMELGGYGLLAYSLFNLARSLAANKLGADPEVKLAVMSNLVGLFPFFLLGAVLVFAPQGAYQAKGLAKQLTRWLVAFFALLFFLFIPGSFLQRHILIERGALQAGRLEEVLQSRKQQILAAVQNTQSPTEIQQQLIRFPEIKTPIAFASLKSPTVIRQQLAASLDMAINLEVNRFRKEQQQRQAGLSKVVLSISLGSLLSTSFLLILSTYLFPSLKQNRHSIARSNKTIIKAISAPISTLKKLTLARLSRPHFSRIFAILGLQQPRSSRRR